MISFYLLCLIAVLNLIIALLVFFRSERHHGTSFFFVLSALSVSFWAFGDALMLGASDPKAVEIGTKLFLVAPLYTMYFLLLFALRFPSGKNIDVNVCLLLASPVLLATYLLFSYTGSVVDLSLASGRELNILQVNFEPFFLYTLLFTGYFVAICAVFIGKVIQSAGVQRIQIMYVFAGAFLSSVLAFATNLALPMAGVSDFVWLGPVFTIAYLVSYTFAIAKYRLFDIRRFAIRAMAYVFSLGGVVVSYVYAITVLRDLIQRGFGIRLDTDAFYIGMTMLAVAVFPAVKRAFDTVSKKLFFKGDYETQDVIDTFSDILLKNKQPESMVKELEGLYRETFSTRETLFVFRDPVLASGVKNDNDEMLRRQLQAYVSSPVMTIDDLDRKTELYRILDEKSVGMIVRLSTAKSKLGWILLGDKMNGEPYDRQDIRTVDIVADEIAIALENALRYKQIQAFNVTLSARVDEATTELRHSNDKLKQLDAAKDEFISMASHQLRTPLTSVKGYLSMVLEGDAGEVPPAQRKLLEEAYASSQRMVYLIGDFLNVSRLQTGKFVVEASELNMAQLVSEEMDQLKQTAASKGLVLKFDKPDTFPSLKLDQNKMRQAIMNLIDNAIYYSRPNTTIVIELLHGSGEVVFRVRDRGIGVPKGEQHRLFTKFYRASNARRVRPDGTGIGLFMTKKVIIAHGGTVIFETKEGIGSTFGFRLPVKR